MMIWSDDVHLPHYLSKSRIHRRGLKLIQNQRVLDQAKYTNSINTNEILHDIKAGIWNRKLEAEAVKAVKFLWKRKHFEERS